MGSCDFIAGWGGGILGLITGHPFDTVKVNQQNRGIGLVQCIQYIYRTRGPKGFYRGLAFPLVTDGALNSIFFGAYGLTFKFLNSLQNDRQTVKDQGYLPENLPNKNNTGVQTKESFENNQPPLPYLHCFLSGCAGGAAWITFGSPVELVKIKLQTTKASAGVSGPLAVLRNIIYTQGPRGLYQGVWITAIRDVPAFGIYMLMYAVLSDVLRKFQFLKDQEGSPNSVRTVFAGGLAGMCSWCSIMPIDTVKSRLQADNPLAPRYNGIIDCVQKIFKTEGFAGFSKGFMPLALRAFPVNAATFLAYEWIGWTCAKLSGGIKH